MRGRRSHRCVGSIVCIIFIDTFCAASAARLPAVPSRTEYSEFIAPVVAAAMIWRPTGGRVVVTDRRHDGGGRVDENQRYDWTKRNLGSGDKSHARNSGSSLSMNLKQLY